MRQVFDKINFVVGSAGILENMSGIPSMRIFDDGVIDFLKMLSSEILKSGEAKKYSDAVTFAFWCRKANLLSLKKQYDYDGRLGRGIAFHIAPSNVPVNFAYSMVASMLAGNANIVRLPSKKFEQTEILCDIIRRLLNKSEFAEIAVRLCLVRYVHIKEITDTLSAMCSSRIIWGGDTTVLKIRRSELPPRSNEITFPDRYSLCLIDADKYLIEYDKSQTARDFYNDTYLIDQNACTSPRIVVWFGKERDKAKEIFWKSLHDKLASYELQPVQTVNKLSTFYKFAANSQCTLSLVNDYRIMRVTVRKLCADVIDNLENSGYFYEYDANSLEEILPVCGIKCQTLSYIGFDVDELQDFVLRNAPSGIDRIVPVGKTMDFALVWDGTDLIRTLSRKVVIT